MIATSIRFVPPEANDRRNECDEGRGATRAEELREGDQQVNGEDE